MPLSNGLLWGKCNAGEKFEPARAVLGATRVATAPTFDPSRDLPRVGGDRRLSALFASAGHSWQDLVVAGHPRRRMPARFTRVRYLVDDFGPRRSARFGRRGRAPARTGAQSVHHPVDPR